MKTVLRSTWVLLTVGTLLIAWDLGVKAAPAAPATRLELESVERATRGLFKDAAERRLEARLETERLKKDLRYISEELDRDSLGEEEQKTLKQCSQDGLARLAGLRRRGQIDPKLLPILDQLENLYRDLATKEYAKDYAADLVKAINEELRWAAETASSDEEMIELLKRDLVLPDRVPQDGDIEDLEFFPQNLPVAQWLKLGPIKIYMAKHRMKRPASYAKTTPADLVAGRHNVQVGVEVEGVCTYASLYPWDQDYTFNIGDLHMEIVPEWRLKHKDLRLPKVGDRIRVRGWSYYDYFHKSEGEYDAADPVLGALRKVVWEIHGVNDVEVIQ